MGGPHRIRDALLAGDGTGRYRMKPDVSDEILAKGLPTFCRDRGLAYHSVYSVLYRHRIPKSLWHRTTTLFRTERMQRVWHLREQGMEFRAIADQIGVSKQRAYQLYAEASRRAPKGLRRAA